MVNRDNGFGDAFAQEVLNVMNSPEHKAIFTKTAQVDFELNPDLGLGEEARERKGLGDYDPTLSAPTDEGAGLNRAITDSLPGEGLGFDMADYNAPGVSDQAMANAETQSKGESLMANPAIMSDPNLLDVANKAATGQPLTPAEKELLMSASAKNKMQKAGGVEDIKKEKQEGQEGMTEYEKQIKKDTSKDKFEKDEAAKVINTLVAVADYLGDKNLKVSEGLADRLIKSFIIEAGKDEDKCDEKCCKKCKCEPCKCKEDEDKKKE